MAQTGSVSLVLSLVVALIGAVAGFRQPGRKLGSSTDGAGRALWAVAALATLASASLLVLLVTRDFQVAYVHQHVSTHMPLVYTISAFWAGREGSLLLWFWLLSVLGALLARDGRVAGGMRAKALCTFGLVEGFFALTIIATSDPFAVYAAPAAEGVGMLPLLQNPGMVVHPPVLFLGYAAFTVPFVLAVGALGSGELGERWLAAARPWNLLAWSTLGAGILIGAWWSYVELGWGGYWAWDPVENASLIPWLLATASLHSAIVELRRGMQRIWNLALPVLAFASCLFATLVTRGGIVVSDLHGFASSMQPIAYYLMSAMVVTVLGTALLIYSRRSLLASPREIQSFVSRESSFLLVNLLLSGAALAVLVGTMFPALARSWLGVSVVLNAGFYNRSVGPMLLVIVALMGVCPALGWERRTRRSARSLSLAALAAAAVALLAVVLGIREPLFLVSATVCSFVVFSMLGIVARDVAARRQAVAESYVTALRTVWGRSRRRYGAHVVHLGIVLIALGVSGSTAYKQEQLVALDKGQSASLGVYTIRYQDVSMEARDAEPVTYQSHIRFATTLDVFRGGAMVDTVVAQKNYHPALEAPWVTEVAIHSTLQEDLYLVLAELEETGRATFQMVINPLVSWIWFGGAVLLAGTLIAAWPRARSHPKEVEDA